METLLGQFGHSLPTEVVRVEFFLNCLLFFEFLKEGTHYVNICLLSDVSDKLQNMRNKALKCNWSPDDCTI